MHLNVVATLVLVAIVAGCGSAPRNAAPAASRTALRVALPPDHAAACFARNAEEHSGALIAEVRAGGNRAEVIVRVKNGVHYGTGTFTRSGTGSTATLELNVMTNSRRSNLAESLLEGC